MLKDFSTSIIQTLRQQGFQAYLVGGCVRDLLLQRESTVEDQAACTGKPEHRKRLFFIASQLKLVRLGGEF